MRGKDAQNRSAYVSQLASLTISRLPLDGSLVHLIQHESSPGPVLVGIHAEIGFPASFGEDCTDIAPTHRDLSPDFLLDRPPLKPDQPIMWSVAGNQ